MNDELGHSPGSLARREPEQQCIVREQNELTEGRQALPASPQGRARLRCECGDPSCLARLRLTHAEYEGVRAYGSRFVIGVNHENPENACVLHETAEFAVVDVIAADARYHVLARNPRHIWPSPLEPSPC